MAGATTVKVDGKVFRITKPEDLDLQQDGYITAILERAGLTDPRLKQLQGESLIKEGQLRLFERGLVGEFLAGYLVEGKKVWAVEGAQASAKTFNALRDRAGRDELFALVGGLLLGFFSSAKSSPSSGPSSSPAPDPAESSELAAASISGSGSP